MTPTPERGDPPKHTYELHIEIGSCDWDVLVRELERLAEHVREHEQVCGLISGGGGRASSIRIEHYPDVTEQSYNAALMAWMGYDQH